ncbi:hypothetical protein WR25_21331 isoform B [Diploscapter pachys]|uniref:RanBP2-type domain-containing protein n=1 Tax=Diploscapter pachys TaxID=2018661 RepID=A0A2A2J3W9_9BILA|nr:hypothetical protein WR25_21331 isoform B [Diploscapter pachys]
MTYIKSVTFTVMIYCGYKSQKALKKYETMLSSSTRALQKSLLKALVLQAMVPLCLAYIPSWVVLSLPLTPFEVSRVTVNNALTTAVTLFPICDCIVIIYYVKAFRNTLIEILGNIPYLNRWIAQILPDSRNLFSLVVEFIQSAISEAEMSNREASHSAAESNYTGPVMGRIVSNVVEMQNHIVQQFQGITTALESLKIEQRQMREDLRRSDDRAMKQVDEIRTVYSRELELLTNIISTLIDKDKAATAAAAAQQHRLTPAQQAFMSASSPASFFNQQPSTQQQQQMAQLAALMQQQHQHQMMTNMLGNTSSSFPPSAPTSHAAVPQPSLPAQIAINPHAAAAAASMALTSTPVNATRPPIVQKVEEKKEVVEELPKPKPITGVPQSTAAAQPVKTTTQPQFQQQQQQPVKQEEKKTEGFGEQFKPKPGSWECTTCYVRNEADVFQCVACGTDQTGRLGDKPSTLAKSAIPLVPAGGQTGSDNKPKFTFGMSAVNAAKDAPPANQKPTALFGASVTNQNNSTLTSGAKPSMFGGSSPKPANGAADSTSGNQQPSFSFAPKPAPTQAASPITFSFKSGGSESTQPKTSIFGQASGTSIFGGTAKKPEESIGTKSGASDLESSPGQQQAKVFGQGFMSGNSSSPFADMLKNVSSKPFYEDPAYVAKAKADMAALKEKEGKKEAEDDGDADANAGADEEYEPQVDFKPVIPTPDLVNVVTGEEDEEVLFNSRAKLFRFVPELKENKERGIGDIKVMNEIEIMLHRMVFFR